MNVTRGEVRVARMACEQLMQLPVRPEAAMKISSLARTLDGPAEDLEKARLKLVDEHARRDDRGAWMLNGSEVIMRNQREFAQAWDRLLAEPIALNGARALTSADVMVAPRCAHCGAGADQAVPAGIYYRLGPFLASVDGLAPEASLEQAPEG